MEIPCGVVGVINNSEKAGHKVRVADDAETTGGFLIYEWWTGSNGPNEAGAFDGWVEDRGALRRYFEEAGWQVQWLV